jgi:hypothetical protein
MDLQHVNVRLYLEGDQNVVLEALIPVFHSWIQDQICEELLIDVADYRHVYRGPGVVLVGHEANYSVDNVDDRLGLRYNRKAMLGGTNQYRFKQALRAALVGCERLESDPRLEGKVRFNRREMELFINDRLLAPNLWETYKILKPELDAFFQEVLRDNGYCLKHTGDGRQLFSVAVQSATPLDPHELLRSLDS